MTEISSTSLSVTTVIINGFQEKLKFVPNVKVRIGICREINLEWIWSIIKRFHIWSATYVCILYDAFILYVKSAYDTN